MKKEKAIEFCNNWLPAWSGNNPDSLIKFYHKNALYTDPTSGGVLTGHDEIFPYLTKLLNNNPDWIWKMDEIFPTKNGFTLKWEASIPVGNKFIKEIGVDIIEVENDKITRNEVYFDTTRLIKAIKKLK